MEQLKNKFFSNMSTRLFFILITVIYILTRLANLNSLPVFADEAIYIRWSQMIIGDLSKIFLSMYDGKPPLFMWLLVPFLKLIRDPLIASRFLSVLLGWGTIMFLYKSVKNLFSRQAGYMAAILALTCPFLFIYNRMALIETLLTFTLSLQIYFLSLFYKTKETKFIIFSGLAWGLSMLSKTTAFFFFTLYLPTGFYLQNLGSDSLRSPVKLIVKNKKIIFNLFLSGLVAFLIFGITKLSVFFPFLFSRSRDFSFTLAEFLGREYKYMGVRAIKIFTWVGYYVSPLVFLLFWSSLVAFFKKNSTKKEVLSHFWLFVLALIVPFIAFGKILAPRYLLPLSLPIIILASDVLVQVKFIKKINLLLLGIVLVFNLYFISTSLINIDKTPFLEVDKVQYLQEWSSGHGIRQAFFYLRDLAQTEKVFVGTEGYYGTLPDGLLIYKDPYNTPNLEIVGVGQLSSVPDLLKEKSLTQRTFLLGNSHRFTFPESEPLKLVKTYDRPAGGPRLLLYEVTSGEGVDE